MPYPYTLTPDGHTMEPEGVVKPPAETQDESTSTQSPFLDFGNPLPPAQQPPPTEQFTGQASSSDSGKQSGAGSSQTQESSDADHGRDETRAQDELPDFEDGQVDYSTAEFLAGLNPNVLPEYSSLDVIHVKKILEARLRTVARIIATSDSFEVACGYLFAFPEDVGGVEVIRRAWSLCQGERGASGGISGDVRNDVEEMFTIDDVRQFIVVGTETTAAGDAAYYEEMLEEVFEYEIVFDDEQYHYSDEEKIRQLQNLARSNLHIVDYLDDLFIYDESRTGLTVFQQHFSESKYGQLKVHLGADVETGGPDLGRGPLPESTEENLDTVFLGSTVNTASIVHEFGHVLDRSLGIEDAYTDTWGTVFPWPDWIRNVGLPLNEDILRHAILGYAGKQLLSDEIWADLFMTAVLDPSNPYIDEPYTVYSTTYPAHTEFVNERAKVLGKPYIEAHGEEVALRIGRNLAIAEFYDCAVHGDCKQLKVRWAEKSPYASKDFGALARQYFPKLLRHLLSG